MTDITYVYKNGSIITRKVHSVMHIKKELIDDIQVADKLEMIIIDYLTFNNLRELQLFFDTIQWFTREVKHENEAKRKLTVHLRKTARKD